MKKKFCIIQPGHIGDVIICLPIAKKLVDQGHEVYWPLWSNIYHHFDKGHIDYVTFKKISKDGMQNWYNSILDYCKKNDIEPVDITFNQIGSWHNNNTQKFNNQKELSFDTFKYKLANIDLNEKWNLQIKRNVERENKLYNEVVKQSEYVVVHFQGSDIRKEIKLENTANAQIIEIKPITDCVFDWIKILENAKCLVLLDSVFSNLVEQLNMKNKKFFIKRRDFINTPTLKNDWGYLE